LIKFWTIDDINPGLHKVLDRFDLIQEEFLENKDKLSWKSWGYDAGYFGQKNIAYQGWEVAGLFGEDYGSEGEWKYGSEEMVGSTIAMTSTKGLCFCKENVVHLPILTKLLYDAGVKRRVGISVTYSGRGIDWHVDDDPEREDEMVIRGLIGLDVRVDEGEECFLGLGTPKKEQRRDIRNGQSIFFYSRMPHRVVNELKYPRYCIICDHVISKEKMNRINTQDKRKSKRDRR